MHIGESLSFKSKYYSQWSQTASLNAFLFCRASGGRDTHLELLDSPLQALCVEVGLFGRQLVLCRLKPPEEGAREAAELEQLLLTGLDGSKPVRGKHRTVEEEDGMKEQKEKAGSSDREDTKHRSKDKERGRENKRKRRGKSRENSAFGTFFMFSMQRKKNHIIPVFTRAA